MTGFMPPLRTVPEVIRRGIDETQCDHCSRPLVAGDVGHYTADGGTFCGRVCAAQDRERKAAPRAARIDYGPDGGDSGSGL